MFLYTAGEAKFLNTYGWQRPEFFLYTASQSQLLEYIRSIRAQISIIYFWHGNIRPNQRPTFKRTLCILLCFFYIRFFLYTVFFIYGGARGPRPSFLIYTFILPPLGFPGAGRNISKKLPGTKCRPLPRVLGTPSSHSNFNSNFKIVAHNCTTY